MSWRSAREINGLGKRAGGGGGGVGGVVYGHRIVSVARSARHVAQGSTWRGWGVGREGRGGEKKKIDGANNQPAEEMPQEMMGCNCGGAELSTKTKELSDKLCKTEGGFIRPP